MPKDGREVDRLVDDYVGAPDRPSRVLPARRSARPVGRRRQLVCWQRAAAGAAATSESSSAAAAREQRGAGGEQRRAGEQRRRRVVGGGGEQRGGGELGGGGDTSAIKQGGTLIEGYDRDFSKNDPVLSTWDDPAWMAIYEFPMIRDAQGGMTPSLFESWEISDDRLTWTFKLRPDLKFQSGAPLDAAKMAENFNIFRDPKTGQNAIFWRRSPTSGRRRQTTVVVTIEEPVRRVPGDAGHRVLDDPTCASARRRATSTASTETDGTGPFTLTEFTPGNQVRSTKWADYPGSNVPFINNRGRRTSTDQCVPILEVSNRANEIEAGGVHAIKNPAPQDLERLTGNPDLVVMEWASPANSSSTSTT